MFYEVFLFILLLTSPDVVKAETVAEQSSVLYAKIAGDKATSQNNLYIISRIDAAQKSYFGTLPKDTRAEKLNVYLTKHNSPAVEFTEVFVQKADEYGLDWRLVAAIFGVESTFGKHVPKDSYNGWGWGIPTGAASGIGFKNWDNGIDVVSKGLKEKYVDRGLDTVEKMGRVYAPPSTTWAANVKFFMNEIENVTLKPELSI